jgi:hypothetical protein
MLDAKERGRREGEEIVQLEQQGRMVLPTNLVRIRDRSRSRNLVRDNRELSSCLALYDGNDE